MPLYQTIHHKNGHIAIWKHESDDIFEENTIMNPQEAEKAKKLTQKKRWEYTMIRQLLHLYAPKTHIQYKDNGAPFLSDNSSHISISHSYPFAVLALSSQPIGIDIEKISEKILRVRDKFINQEEEKWLKNQENKQILTAIWSAKEALYKIHPSKLWSLKKHYTLSPFPYQNLAETHATVHSEDFQDHYTARFFLIENDFVMSMVHNHHLPPKKNPHSEEKNQ